MFDVIKGEVVCPYCKSTVIVQDQIKWIPNEYRSCHTYRVGDKLPHVIDGIYTGGSTARKQLSCLCSNCNEYIRFTGTVKDSKLVKITVRKVMEVDDRN